MAHAGLDEYLAAGETIRRSWRGDMDTEDNDTPRLFAQHNETTFAATDQRIMYVDGDGGFKDIDFKHVSSVEAEKSEDEEPSLLQLLFFGGIIAAGIGLFLLIDGQALGVLLMLAGLGVTALIATSVDDVEEFLQTEKKTTYTIRLITGDEAHSQITFKTEENVGADLSRVVREHNPN